MRMGCPSCGRDVDCPPGTKKLTCPGCGFTAALDAEALAAVEAAASAEKKAPSPKADAADGSGKERPVLPWLACPECGTKVMLQPGAKEVVCPGCAFSGKPPKEDPPAQMVDSWRVALGLPPQSPAEEIAEEPDPAAAPSTAQAARDESGEVAQAETEDQKEAAQEPEEKAAPQEAEADAVETDDAVGTPEEGGWVPVADGGAWKPVPDDRSETPAADAAAPSAKIPDPTATPPGGQEPRRKRPRRAPGALGWNTGFAALALLFGVVGLIIDFTAPWMDPDVGPNQDRSDIADAGGYMEHLVEWPLAAFIVLLIVGVALLGVRFAPLPAVAGRSAQAALMGTGLLLSFMLLVSAVRWFGMYFIDAAKEGELTYHLHVVPYFHLAMGLVLFSMAASGVRRLMANAHATPGEGILPPAAGRAAGMALALSAALLLFMPLIPYASLEAPALAGPGTWPMGEADLGGLRDAGTTDIERPGNDLLVYRAMLWAGMGLAAAAWAWAAIDATGRVPRGPAWTGLIGPGVFALATLLWLVAFIFTILLYVHLPAMEDDLGGDVTITWNHLPLLGVLALFGLQAWHGLRVAWPVWRSVQGAPHG